MPTASWLDDLAAIVAAWLDGRPVAHRALLGLLTLFAAPALVLTSPYAAATLLLLLLPRMPRLRGRIVLVVGLVLALAGTARIVATQRTWQTFPQEDGLGLTLLALGILLGARRGLWWPWLLCGAAAGLILEPPFGVSAFMLSASPVVGVLFLVLAARVSAAPRPPPDMRVARARLAVALPSRPWPASFAVCAIASVATLSVVGLEPALGTALIAVLFHATWRAPTLFDKASAWTAALLVPVASAVLLWWLPSSFAGTTPSFGPGRSMWDYVLTPVMAFPLLAGLAVGRRAPGRRFTALDAVLVALAVLAPAATLLVVTPSTAAGAPDLPKLFEVGFQYPLLWTTVTALWLLPFHRIAATNLSARRIVWGAVLAGAVQLATILVAAHEPDTTVTVARGALAPVVAWIAAALLLLVARDVARVTRIPDDHPVVADFRSDPQDVRR